jgi:hypothetical protein
MTQVIRMLGQVACGTATGLAAGTVYASPGTSTALAYVTLANRVGGTVTVRLSQTVGTAAPTDKDYLLYDFPIPPNDAWTVQHPLAVGTADIIRCSAGSANAISAQAYGIERT